MTPEDIRALVARIGAGGYRPGSSTQPGRPYQPIPFPEFADIEAQKGDSVRREFGQIIAAMQSRGIRPRRVLDVGACVGFYAFEFARRFGCQVVAVESDPDARAVLASLASWSGLPVETPASLDSALEVPFDLALMVNVHQWIDADLGPAATLALMRRIGRQAGTLFFQTAHDNGSAFRTVPYLTSFDDLVAYLQHAGFKSVEFVAENQHRGAPRYLFLASMSQTVPGG